MKKFFSILLFLLILPVVAMAFDIPPPPAGGWKIDPGLLKVIDFLLNILWQIFFGFAVIMFLYSGFQILAAKGNIEKIKEARQSIIWGVMGVIVGILAFSIPAVIKFSLGPGV